MFEAVSLFRNPKQSPRRSLRPMLEALETRDCPAGPGSKGPPPPPPPNTAPQITTFNWSLVYGRQITLTGHVTDENPTTCTVNFGGMASGSVTPNANGDFSLQVEATALGNVTAQAVDAQSLTSNTSSVTLTSNVPTMTLMICYGDQNNITLMGYVNDESLGLNHLTFTGAVTGSDTDYSDGHYAFDVAATQLGQISATATDCWGQVSQAATQLLDSMAPEIVDFSVIQDIDGYWEFSGRVTDENPVGLTVTVSGLPSVQNVQVAVEADGWFHYYALLPLGESGTATAHTKDWFNLDSNTACWLVR